MAAKQILLISLAEESGNHQLESQLSESGFTLSRVDSAASARAYFQEYGLPYLVVVDLGLPEKQGLEICEELYEYAGLPIIALASEDTNQQEALAALQCADDYVRRAYLSAEELMMRIRRILTRVNDFSYSGGPSVQITDWLSYRPVDSHVIVRGEVRNLTSIENRLLQVLLAHRGKIVDPATLFERVWHSGESNESLNILRVHIHRLRKKIEDDPYLPQLLLTTRGQGYMMAVL